MNRLAVLMGTWMASITTYPSVSLLAEYAFALLLSRGWKL
jgi:hypothetical protein